MRFEHIINAVVCILDSTVILFVNKNFKHLHLRKLIIALLVCRHFYIVLPLSVKSLQVCLSLSKIPCHFQPSVLMHPSILSTLFTSPFCPTAEQASFYANLD